MALHILHDGSNVKLISARQLVAIEIWNGNRIIDTEHVKKIKASLTDIKLIDFGFRIITRMVEDAGGNIIKESKIIDGQHRHKVLTDYFQDNLCAEDFQVLVLEKEVSTESEIITYFKQLNTQLPIAWKSDPAMVANEYIKAIEGKFNTKKEKMVRDSSTKRPYLSIEKIREKFLEIFKQRGIASESSEEIHAFIERVLILNERLLKDSDMVILQGGKRDIIDIVQKAATKKFMLAVDPKLKWIHECLYS
jgi:hypothetical protein